MRHIPNLITITRMLLAPLLVFLIAHHQYRSGTGLVAFAGLTDFLDGYAARKLGSSGQSGVVLDPAADKLMLVALFFALWWVGLIANWLAALVLGRDLIIVGGAGLLRQLRGVRGFRPSKVGKVSTFFQIVFVLLVLIHAAYPNPVLHVLELTALVLTTIFTAASGFGYIQLGLRLERETRHTATA